MISPPLTRRSALGLALAGVAASTVRAEGAASFAAVDAAAAALVEDHGAPGVSLSLMKAGRIVHTRGFGSANLETGTPAHPDSIYRIGSITKQFTAAALMSLAEEGRLSPDDRLARFFPDFPRAGEITLRQMLTHTSGLSNYTDTAGKDFLQEARLDYDAKALYRLMLESKPLYSHEPGVVWDYSNTAYVLLGLLVEKIAGEPYGEFYKRRLFDRAGLLDTAVDDAAVVVARRAAGYTPRPGVENAFDNASFISMTIPGGAGSMRSTSEDLCRWHAALFGGKIVSAASLAQMTTPQRLKDGSLPMSAVGPGAEKSAPVQYGFGLQRATVEGHQVIGHGGGINGFRSNLQTFPDTGFTYALLINCEGGPKLDAHAKLLREALVQAATA